MEVNFKNGYVVLPREDYDRIQRELERLEDTLDNIITLRESYDHSTIDVEYNNELLYALANKQFIDNHEWHDEYVLVSKIVSWSSTIATRIKEEEQADD